MDLLQGKCAARAFVGASFWASIWTLMANWQKERMSHKWLKNKMLDISISWKSTSFKCVTVSNWISSYKRRNCSPWWRDFVHLTASNVQLCLTPTKCSQPPRNASPSLSPKSTLAGNSGSSECAPKASESSLCIGSINTHVLHRMQKGMFRRSLQNWWQQNPVHLGFSVETALSDLEHSRDKKKKKNN